MTTCLQCQGAKFYNCPARCWITKPDGGCRICGGKRWAPCDCKPKRTEELERKETI